MNTRPVGSLPRLAIVLLATVFLESCPEVAPLGGCKTDEDCPADRICVEPKCVPRDPCGAGVYNGQQTPPVVPDGFTPALPPESMVVVQVAGEIDPATGLISKEGVTSLGDTLELTGGSEEKRFEADFWDEPTKNEGRAANAQVGVFVEASVAVDGSGQCNALLYIWPDRLRRVELCVGGETIQFKEARIDDVETREFHRYRLEVRPLAAAAGGEEQRGASGDAEGRPKEAAFLYIDGVLREQIDLEVYEPAPSSERPERIPLVGFGVRGSGRSSWDWVRWGCLTESGPCIPELQDDDRDPNCATRREGNGPCPEPGRAPRQELCDEIDNDCDSIIDENWKKDAEGDGVGDKFPFSGLLEDGTRFDFFLDSKRACTVGACTDGVVQCHPDRLSKRLFCDVSGSKFLTSEICDDADNDCDGLVDENFKRDDDDRQADRAGAAEGDDDKVLLDFDGRHLGLGESCPIGICQDSRVVCTADGMDLECRLLRRDAATGDLSPPLRGDACGNNLDDDCDGNVDDLDETDGDGDGVQGCPRCYVPPGQPIPPTLPPDCDTELNLDCDDDDPTTHPANPLADIPAAPELCDNKDNDCDGEIDEGWDEDGDGYKRDCEIECRDENGLPVDRDEDGEADICAPDCDDDDPTVNPGAPERCNHRDDDCNGIADDDERFTEAQGGDQRVRLYSLDEHCGRCSTEQNVTDCTVIGPARGTLPVCVLKTPATLTFACSDECDPRHRDVDGDDDNGCECPIRDVTCDDPDAESECAEACNGVDDNCDGTVDEPAAMQTPRCYTGEADDRRDDPTTRCRSGRVLCADGALQPADEEHPDNCVGQVLPLQNEECNGIDDDCDGEIDEEEDLPTANLPCQVEGQRGVCRHGVLKCTQEGQGENAVWSMQCDTPEPSREICNRLDDDCDGVVDNDTDLDFDGASACRPCNEGEAANYVPPGADEPLEGVCVLDCNDNNRQVFPGAPEVCNAEFDQEGREISGDDDCDGQYDEDFRLYPNPANPEEFIISHDQHCGACGETCDDEGKNAIWFCNRGECAIRTCLEGFVNADLDPSNGCEESSCSPVTPNYEALGDDCIKDIVSPAHCKCVGRFACNATDPDNVSVDCRVNDFAEGDAIALADCDVVFADSIDPEACDGVDNDCDGQTDEDFKQTDPQGNTFISTVDHCGACNQPCRLANARTTCTFGECRVAECEPNFHNLDGEHGNGCEYQCRFQRLEDVCNNEDDDCDGQIDEDVDTNTNVNHCGACNNACRYANATGVCVAGVCHLDECLEGFADCRGGEADGCETPLGTTDNCARCGDACPTLVANRCVLDQEGNRVCKCGDADRCDDDGDDDTRVCDDNIGRCEECLETIHCPPGLHCTNRRCTECDRVTHEGCDPATTGAICGQDGTCRSCRNDAECLLVGGQNLSECVPVGQGPEGQPLAKCAACDPADNSGCPADRPTCDAETLTCRRCERNEDCITGECITDEGDPRFGRCTGCDPATHAPCSGATPICDPITTECRPCNSDNPGAGDAECADRGEGQNKCVAGRCQTCDPTTHEGCAADELCCNFRCVATGVGNGADCPACNLECDTDTANVCTNRACRCGAEPACGGRTPFCDADAPEGAHCVNCRDDDDCGDDRPFCVDNVCQACNPLDEAGCDANGTRPVCDDQEKICRGCANNAECRGRQCVADGSCKTCNPATHAGCQGGQICTAQFQCVDCGRHEECADHPAGPVCSGGRCTTCAGAADCAGHPSGNVCDGGVCRSCQGHGDCVGHPAGGVCISGLCRQCGADADCAGHANFAHLDGPLCVPDGGGRTSCERCDPRDNRGCGGDTPVCVVVNGDPTCQACSNDNPCPNGTFCVGGRCEACVPNSNQGCAPNGASPICDPDALSCRPCIRDAECGFAGSPGGQCVEGRCQPCDYTDGAGYAGCVPDGNQPICVLQQNGLAACVACADDQQCADGARNGGQCILPDGRCEPCDPADHAGCAAGQLCCDDGNGNPECHATHPATECESCGQACPVEGADRCVDNQCRCGENAACDPQGQAPVCSGGSCVQCTRDDHCANHVNGPVCVDNLCRACDVDTHEGCRDDQLCCLNGGVPTCVDTGPGNNDVCPACDVSCNEDTSDTCASRLCKCGANPPCGGTTPFCDDANDTCVACLVDAHCPAGLQCVSGTCRLCDPDGDVGCDADGNQPICDPNDFECRACANNGECPAGEVCLQDGRCGACDPADDEGCGAVATEPVCDTINGALDCRGCASDAECEGNVNADGNVCLGTGECSACNGDADCGGHPEGNLCDVQAGLCGPCAADGDCANHPDGNLCDEQDGLCVACAGDAECAGHANGLECIGGRCEACDDNADCAGDADGALCVNGVCQATCLEAGDIGCEGATPQCVGGTCEACDPNDNAGCDPDGDTPICDANDNTCRACAGDNECPAGEVCLQSGGCDVCDPADHSGCDVGESCCDTGAGNACQLDPCGG